MQARRHIQNLKLALMQHQRIMLRTLFEGLLRSHGSKTAGATPKSLATHMDSRPVRSGLIEHA